MDFNQIAKHMETNVLDAILELDQKLSLQLKVLGVKEEYPLDTFKDLLDRLDTTLDLVLMKIRATSQEIMEFTKTEVSETALDVGRDLTETIALKNLELHLKMDNVLKQIKADIHPSSNIKEDDCALGTISEGGAGAGVNKVRSETTKTYGRGTPARSSSQWLDGAD